MPTFDFPVQIEASNKEEATAILKAMFDIMKTTRAETSTQAFILFAKKLKDKPSLVRKAQFFL